MFLQLQHFHGVVEVAEQLITAFSPFAVAAPLQLALALAYRALNRPSLAAAQLQSVVAAITTDPADPRSPAAAEPAMAQNAATVLFLLAQSLAENDATDVALTTAQQALSWLAASSPSSTVLKVTAMQQALATLLSSEPQATRRAVLFFRLQTLAAAQRYDDALTTTAQLLNEEPHATDAHLAQAALLNRLQRYDEALLACSQAQQTLRPLDRLLEDEDPLAVLRLHQAVALAGLGQLEAAALGIQAALSCDPRTLQRLLPEPTLTDVLTAVPDLQALLESADSALFEADPRTAARHAAAACLRSTQPGTALFALLHDFFAAMLMLHDAPPSPRRIPAAMSLLSSLEAQLDVLAASGVHAALSPTIHAASAAMAEALDL